MAATGAVRLPVQSDLSKPVEPCQGLGVKLVLVSVVAITSGCVPMAKPLPTGTSTLNAPPPPASQKNATSLLNETPSIVAPNEPPPPLPGQRHALSIAGSRHITKPGLLLPCGSGSRLAAGR